MRLYLLGKGRMNGALIHVVLVSFHAHVAPAQRDAMREKQQALGGRCGGAAAGIRYWQVGYNLDQRKQYHLMQFSMFDDPAAFERFRAHPAHIEIGIELRELADWIVGDMCVPPVLGADDPGLD